MGKAYKASYIELQNEKRNLESQVAKLSEDNSKLEEELVSSKQAFTDAKSDFDKRISDKELDSSLKISGLEVEKEELIKKVSSLEEANNQKQSEINKRELRKMAEAYAEQEEEYKKSIINWLVVIFLSFSALAGSFFWALHQANGKPWFERFEFYILDFIFISAVWFSAAQYSYYVKLRNDYANRKTLAQTYHNILLSIGETSESEENTINTEIKKEFMKKAADVFCAPSISETKEPILSKELLKNAGKAAEIIIKSK